MHMTIEPTIRDDTVTSIPNDTIGSSASKPFLSFSALSPNASSIFAWLIGWLGVFNQAASSFLYNIFLLFRFSMYAVFNACTF